MNKTILNIVDVFSAIKSDFTSLWEYKQRGETIEIITPFSLLSGSFISVFLTVREDSYIVADGQRVSQIINDLNLDWHRSAVQAYLEKTSEHYGVKKINNNNAVFYFKVTKDIMLLTACIYDLIHFQIAALNSIYSSQVFVENEQAKYRQFSTRVNDLIRRRIADHALNNDAFELEQNASLTTFHYSTVIKKRGSSYLWAAMCITGSTPTYFCSSMSKAYMGFGYVKSRPDFRQYVKIAAIFDERAKGYDLTNDRVRIQRDYMMAQCDPASYTFGEFEKITHLDALYK